MAKLLNQLDFKKALIVGLIIIIIGCCLFCITPHVTDYVVFLVALFVLAAGVVMLQVSANILTTLLGNAETASARLSFAQGLNSLGYILSRHS